MPTIGPLEIGILLVVLLIVFGVKRLPDVGSGLGSGIRGFAKGLKGEDDEQLEDRTAVDPAEPRIKGNIRHD